MIPFATAVAVAGVWNWQVTLLLVSVLCFYLARTSFLKHNYQWTVQLLVGSAGAALPLLLIWELWWLAAFGVGAAALAFRKTERSIPMQLIAVAGLTMTAPAAWYTATGKLDYQLWLLNFLYFAGGVFYVKMHIAAAIARQVNIREQGLPTLIYYGGLTVVAAFWLPVGYAFIPSIGRAIAGVVRLSPVLRIKHLGWTEVAHSVIFAGVLGAILRSV